MILVTEYYCIIFYHLLLKSELQIVYATICMHFLNSLYIYNLHLLHRKYCFHLVYIAFISICT